MRNNLSESGKTEKTQVKGVKNGSVATVRVIRNAFFNSSAWVFIVFLSLLTTPYLVKKLTLEGYGIYALLTGLVGYYSLLDLGLGQGLIKFVAHDNAIGNDKGIQRSINTALFVQAITGGVGSICLLVFAEPLIHVLKISDAFQSDALIGIRASAVGFFFTMITGTLSSTLMGLQRYDITMRVNVISNLTLTVLIVLALFWGFGLVSVVIITVAMSILSCGAYFIILRRSIPSWRMQIARDIPQFTRIFSYSGFMFVSQISSLFSNYVVRFVVSYFFGPAAVALYVIPAKLISAFGGVLSSAFGVLFPYASELQAINDTAGIQKSFLKGSKLFAILAVPILLTISIFAKPILTLWMGSEFASEGASLLQVLALSGLLGSLTTVPNTIVMGLGFAKLIGFFSLFSILFYVTLLPWFTMTWGVQGTTWAVLLATLPGLLLVLYEASRIIKLSLWDYAKSTLGFHAGPIVIGFAFAILSPVQNAWSVTEMAAVGILFLTTYFYMMYAFKWIPTEMLQNQIKNLFRTI